MKIIKTILNVYNLRFDRRVLVYNIHVFNVEFAKHP